MIVHCFFEQSGTFRDEFRKCGIKSYDYDIRNDYGKTDHIIDLFAEIEKAYDDKASVFDSVNLPCFSPIQPIIPHTQNSADYLHV